MIQLGDTISVTPVTFGGSEGNKNPKGKRRGVVVYIHSKRRFFTAEFALPGGKVRESFHLFRERKDDE